MIYLSSCHGIQCQKACWLMCWTWQMTFKTVPYPNLLASHAIFNKNRPPVTVLLCGELTLVWTHDTNILNPNSMNLMNNQYLNTRKPKSQQVMTFCTAISASWIVFSFEVSNSLILSSISWYALYLARKHFWCHWIYWSFALALPLAIKAPRWVFLHSFLPHFIL